MKIGISAFAWTGKFDREYLRLIETVKEMGFAGFEISMFDPTDLPVSEIRRAFQANDLECTVCCLLPAEINPISPDAETRRKSVQHLIQCVETASDLGATLLGGPLYAPIGYQPGHRPTQDEWTWAVEAFQAVCGKLDARNLTLSVEPVNRSETFFLRTAHEARILCEAVGHPRFGVTIDTFHANIEERNIADAIGSLGSYLKHLHMSENDRGLLGKGHVGFEAIIDVLRASGYGGFLMIEGFGYSPLEPSAPGALWAETSVSPEEIAYRGASYLNGLLHA